MRVLVWQWGRRGAGPRYASELADGLRAVPGVQALLSLSVQAEIMQVADPPGCDLPYRTYDSRAEAARRLLLGPFAVAPLSAKLRPLELDAAICAMPAALDLIMAAALRRAGVPFAVVVHDADSHPGDRLPLQMTLQRALVRRANALVVLSAYVATRLREQGFVGRKPLIMTSHPPFAFGPPPPPPLAHGGPLRLLSFGRLLPYKGLDLLADALRQLGPRPDLVVRVVGSGPESAALDALRALPNVGVENRWVSEAELGALFAWADALVLSHREASQSGVAAAAMAARRWLIATRVGGLAEQVRNEPLALLCDPDPASLSATLVRLLDRAAADRGCPEPIASWRRTAELLLRDLDAALLAPRHAAQLPRGLPVETGESPRSMAMEPRDKKPRPDDRAAGTAVEQEQSYDDAVADSFPASDPPAVSGITGPRRAPDKERAEET